MVGNGVLAGGRAFGGWVWMSGPGFVRHVACCRIYRAHGIEKMAYAYGIGPDEASSKARGSKGLVYGGCACILNHMPVEKQKGNERLWSALGRPGLSADPRWSRSHILCVFVVFLSCPASHTKTRLGLFIAFTQDSGWICRYPGASDVDNEGGLSNQIRSVHTYVCYRVGSSL